MIKYTLFSCYSMWTYASYILSRICERGTGDCTPIPFEKLSTLIFERLYKKDRIIFYDGKNDLLEDLVYLRDLNILDFNDEEDFSKLEFVIKDREQLQRIANIVRRSGQRTKIEILNDYVNKIDKATLEYRI